MGYEPRMRGRRFGRPRTRKTSSRERREERPTSTFYREPEQVDPTALSTNALNALRHLGDQRFTLPPYGEHFDRWLKDVKGVLAEFERKLADAADQQYYDRTQQALAGIEEALNKQIEEEKSSSTETSNLQQQLTATEIELSRMEHDYSKQTHEIKRQHQKAAQKLREEIDELGKQRLTILRKRTNFLGRIFGRSDSTLEEKTGTLQTKKKELGASENSLRKELVKYRTDYDSKRKCLSEEQKILRGKLLERRGKTLDDALEIRRQACQELQQAVNDALERVLKIHPS
jgi:chromosome segregation ATPase